MEHIRLTHEEKVERLRQDIYELVETIYKGPTYEVTKFMVAKSTPLRLISARFGTAFRRLFGEDARILDLVKDDPRLVIGSNATGGTVVSIRALLQEQFGSDPILMHRILTDT